LIWVGGKFYSTKSFLNEAVKMGISRRISVVPKDFVLGETWVLLAHRETPIEGHEETKPAIFSVFRPERIEYIVKPDDPEEKLERLEKRGITLVDVKPMQSEMELAE